MARNEDFDDLTIGGTDVATTLDLDTHTSDTSNPHAVTAAQADALPISGGMLTGDLTLQGPGEILFGLGGDIEARTDSTIAGEENTFVIEVIDEGGADTIWWRRVSQAGRAFSIFNDTTQTRIFDIQDNGDAEISGMLDMLQNPIGGVDYIDLFSRDGSGDNWRLITYDDTGNFVFQHYPSGGGFQDAFEIEPAGTVIFPIGIDATQVSVGTDTEISESAGGSTVIQNNAGNPVNIQLAPSGRAYLVGNTTTTTIDTQDQWVEISGTWSASNLNHLSHTSGTLTYDGDVTTQVEYNVGGAYSSTDNTASYEIGMFTDGSLKPDTAIDFSPPRAGETLALPPILGFTDSTTSGMTHSVRVRCTSGTSDLTISSLNFTMKG